MKTTLCRLSGFALLTIILLSSVCLYRTFVVFKQPEPEAPCELTKNHKPIIDTDNLVARFSRAIQFRTVTRGVRQVNEIELTRFTDWLQTAYPYLHNSKYVTLEKVANYSLLYTIKGSNPNLKPYMLCSHLDVVPVEMDKWSVDPFAGVVKDGYVYGRGTIDVKDTLISIYEAFEHLFKNEHFVPERTVILAFGHDEEGSGVIGAAEMGRILKERNIELEYILDEGTFISKHSFPGIDNLIAFVGVAEKGYLTVEYTARGETGHSSMPPKDITVVRIAKTASKFNADALPSMFGKGPEVTMIESLAPYARFPFNVIYSNLWLFGSIIGRLFETSPLGNSLVRTTSAPTMIRAGFKENILPSEASVVVNQRVHPGQSIAQVLDLNRQLINDDTIEQKVQQSFEPHPYSPYDDDNFGYQSIKRSVGQVFRDALVVPGIMVASTDTKHYLHLTRSVFRFSPAIMVSSEIKRFHGHDERILIDNYVQIVNFYHHLVKQSDLARIDKPRLKDEL